MDEPIASPYLSDRRPRLDIGRACDAWQLHHESRHGDSWALLDRYDSRDDERRACR